MNPSAQTVSEITRDEQTKKKPAVVALAGLLAE